MTWAALLALAACAYAFKAVGPVLARQGEVRPAVAQVLDLLAVPILAAVVVVQTFDGGERLTIDARAGAVGVAVVLAWRRAPFLVVVLAAAATAAALRAL
jgi:branched-subunit amino acid transport protein